MAEENFRRLMILSDGDPTTLLTQAILSPNRSPMNGLEEPVPYMGHVPPNPVTELLDTRRLRGK